MADDGNEKAIQKRIPATVMLKPKTDPEIFWFEDEYLDDDQMEFLRKVLGGNI